MSRHNESHYTVHVDFQARAPSQLGAENLLFGSVASPFISYLDHDLTLWKSSLIRHSRLTPYYHFASRRATISNALRATRISLPPFANILCYVSEQ